MTGDIDCIAANPEDAQALFKRLHKQRLPLNGSINLTDRCNLRCLHCYLGERTTRNDELSTAEWLHLLDDITEAGCLFLLITGGDPLLRDDFVEIYTHSKRNGLLPGLFTNGTLITDEICRTLRAYPPRYVEISLYGSTSETYGKITGSPAMFSRCIGGIERLLDANITVKLKTVLMTNNLHEFREMEAIASKYDVPFRMDPLLFPKLNGDKSPIALRVDPEVAIEHELRDQRKRDSLVKYYKRNGEIEPSTRLYECGSARNTFHIDANGTLRGCILSDDVTYDTRQGSFKEGWEQALPALREMRVSLTNECRSCKLRVLCGICPPIAKSEQGDVSAKCSYLCSLGKHRHEMITQTIEEDQEG